MKKRREEFLLLWYRSEPVDVGFLPLELTTTIFLFLPLQRWILKPDASFYDVRLGAIF
jgi:hypothetical protein